MANFCVCERVIDCVRRSASGEVLSTNTVTHKTVSEIRMRERISMKSKMLGALALFTLIGALFIMQSAGNSPPTVDAATGTIDALNVGTCLTTDADIFEKVDCGLSQDKDESDEDVAWEIREEVTEVSDLYATYAYDPKTASDEPRVILQESDLIKISIADSDRDKRTGVLIRGASADNAIGDDDDAGTLGAEIRADLSDDGLDFPTAVDDDQDTDDGNDIAFSSHTAGGDGITVYNGSLTGNPASTIANSGNVTLNFSRSEDTFKFAPMDVDGTIRIYGCKSEDANCAGADEPFELLDQIEVDEDASQGNAGGDTAPWLGVNASVESDIQLVILAIYYQTSNTENLVGGQAYRECSDDSAPSEDDGAWSCAGTATLSENNLDTDIVYTEDEIDDNVALEVRAKSDGDEQSVNLYLSETDLFTGCYEGYLRLTDSERRWIRGRRR